MKVSHVVSDIIQIINRRHSDLQNLDADDHLQYLTIGRHDTPTRHHLSVLDSKVVSQDNIGTSYILTGLDANKPTPGINGRLYYATDTGKLYRDNGTSWVYLEDLNKLTKPSGAVQGAILYYNGTNWVVLAPGTNGQFLKTQGSGANPVWDSPSFSPYDLAANKYYVISNDVYFADDTEEYTYSTSYVKLKEFTLPSDFPTLTLRIYFEWKPENTYNAGYVRVYKNGNPYGTEQTGYPPDYVSYTQDLSFTANDKIQLYARSVNSSYRVYVRNFRILGTPIITCQKYNITLTG
jgi:hypothetical protein